MFSTSFYYMRYIQSQSNGYKKPNNINKWDAPIILNAEIFEYQCIK